MDSDAPIPLIKRAADPAPIAPSLEPAVPDPAIPTPVRARNWGSLIGIVAIVLLIVLAAFYSWGERLALQEAPVTEAGE